MRPITPQQNTKMRLRMRLLAAVLAVGGLGGLTVRLFVLMLRDPGGYAARAADQQLRGATLPAARGEIYSADGTLLAASETCWTIRAAPREMADDKVEPAARVLSEILELDYDDTLAKFSESEMFWMESWEDFNCDLASMMTIDEIMSTQVFPVICFTVVQRWACVICSFSAYQATFRV